MVHEVCKFENVKVTIPDVWLKKVTADVIHKHLKENFNGFLNNEVQWLIDNEIPVHAMYVPDRGDIHLQFVIQDSMETIRLESMPSFLHRMSDTLESKDKAYMIFFTLEGTV